jgi:hypothetical protein
MFFTRGARSMRGFERRESGSYPYFKLATWDDRSMTYRAGKVTFPTDGEAKRAAVRPGRYRIESFEESTSSTGEPFTITIGGLKCER